MDLDPRFDAAVDITALPFRDGAFDLVVCSHVLEHVADDRAAAHELARVLSRNGRAIVQVPQVLSMAVTHEDPSLGPDERAEQYGQEDHLRLYGADFPVRLRSAGLDVAEMRAASFGGDAKRWAISDDEVLYDCTKLIPAVDGP